MSDLEERNEQIGQFYLEGLSGATLARKFGLSEAMIRKILAELNINAAQRAPRRGLLEVERKPITPLHKKLGDLVYYNRQLVLKQTSSEATARLGWSYQKLSSVEKGCYDVTLLDLLDLGSYIKQDLSEVLKW